MTQLDEYWNKFLTDQKLPPETKCAGDLFFEAKNFVSDELIALLISGQKTAFFSSYATFAIDQEPLPVSGELYVVVDRTNKPVCIIELESVNILPFNEVTWEMAKRKVKTKILKPGKKKNRNIWKTKAQFLVLNLHLTLS